MIQIYFLSIFFNVLAGYALISGDDKDALEVRPGFSFKDETTRLILGVLSMVTGVLKILSATEGDLPILGDLIPAIAGFTAGIILVMEYYKRKATIVTETEGKAGLNTILISNKNIAGYIAVAAAILHFLFPKVILL